MIIGTAFKKIIASIGLLTLPTLADAATYEVDSAQSKVEFLAVGKPGFLKIKGEGAKVGGKVEHKNSNFNGSLNVSLKDLRTGMELRDEHMHDKYLETKKFPDAVLTLTLVKMKNNEDCEFQGKLKIKEAEKPVSGECSISGLNSAKVSVKANTTIKISDYPSIGVPKHLGITVAEAVTINAELVAHKAK